MGIPRNHGLQIFIGLVLAIALSTLLAFILQFHNQDFSQQIKDWGSFGNYLGSLAALFGFATFLLLLVNLKISRDQFQATQAHNELLLHYKVIKTCASEIDNLLGMTDQIGEFDPTTDQPVEFPLHRLRNRRIILSEEDIRENPTLRQLFPTGPHLAHVGEFCLGEKFYLDNCFPGITWYRHLVQTHSPFIQLIRRLVEFNRLLGNIKKLSPDSPLPDHFTGRYENVFLVLAQSQYLKQAEAGNVLTTEDKDIAINRMLWDARIVDADAQSDLAIDQLRDGMEPNMLFGRWYYSSIVESECVENK